MSEAGRAMPRKEGSGPGDVLRAKYLDYCSAQLADLLLLLTPDEIYLLAQEATRESERGDELSYEEIVQAATQRLFSKMTLPPFEIWLEDYRAHPEYYERYLMGFWREDVESAPEP